MNIDMRKRSLRQVHSKFISEAYGSWTPFTEEDIAGLDGETITQSFRKAYADLRDIAGYKALYEGYQAYKNSSQLYKTLTSGEGGVALRYMCDDFFNNQMSFASEIIRSAGESPRRKALIINAFQQILEDFEPFLRKASSVDSETAVDEIIKFIDSLPRAAAIPFLIVMRSRSLGDLLFSSVDPKTYEADLRRAFNAPFRRALSGIKIMKILGSLKKEWSEFKENYDRLTGGRLPFDVREAVDDFVNLLRLHGENPDYPLDKQHFKDYVLGDNDPVKKYDIDSIDEILDIPKTDPDVGPESEERIKKYLVYRSLILKPIGSYEIRTLANKLQRRIDYVALLQDNRFMSTMESMMEATGQLLKVGDKTFTKVVNDLNTKAGPRALEPFARFGRILRLLRDEPTFRGIEKLKSLNISLGFLDVCKQVWENATETEKDNVLDIIKEITAHSVEFAKEEQEKRRKEHPPEAPTDADFRPLDDYAFAMDRSDVELPEEPDNELEASLYKNLRRHFVENVPITFEQAELIASIMKKGYYKDIFHEPEQEWIFRGMGVSDKWLREFIGVGEDEPLPKKASRTGNFTLKPREGQGSTSWSVKREKALTFSETADHKIILIASSRENSMKFVTSPGGLYKVKGFTDHEHEAEVIGLGPIKVSRIFWKGSYDYSDMTLKTPEEEP